MNFVSRIELKSGTLNYRDDSRFTKTHVELYY